VLTVVDGQVVHAGKAFTSLAPALPPVSPDGSPLRSDGGYQQRTQPSLSPRMRQRSATSLHAAACSPGCSVHRHRRQEAWLSAVPGSEGIPGHAWLLLSRILSRR
jgi:hypothetical protein